MIHLGKCPKVLKYDKILLEVFYHEKGSIKNNGTKQIWNNKKLVDHNGNKLRASCKLCLSLRQVNRLIITYIEKGKYIPPITHPWKAS